MRIISSQVDSTLEMISHPKTREGNELGKQVSEGTSEGQVGFVEKEWVVKPGFGDIGDRYYSI